MRHAVVFIVVVSCILLLVLSSGCTQQVQSPASPTPSVTDRGASASPSNPPATALEIKTYVDKAAAFARETGKPAAIAAFGNKTGPFVNGDTYIYALDYNGTALALPFQPEQVGTNFIPKLDATGKPYTEIEVKLARAGGGYILYHYPVPADNTSSRLKISYVRPVDDTYWIGAGIYTTEDLFVDPALKQYIAEAKDFAIRNGKTKAIAEFNNLNGSFVRGDLYTFAYDYNGTLLAWPYRPDLLGQNRFSATDPVGSHHIQEMIGVARNGSGMVDYYSVNPATNATDLKISYVTDVDGGWFIGTGRYIEPGPAQLRP